MFLEGRRKISDVFFSLQQKEITTLFRTNSFASKLLKGYTQLCGGPFVAAALQKGIQRVLAMDGETRKRKRKRFFLLIFSLQLLSKWTRPKCLLMWLRQTRES